MRDDAAFVARTLRQSDVVHPPSFPEDEPRYQPQEQASQVALPGYAWKKRQEEEYHDCHPQWHGDGDGEYDNRRPGHQYRQGTAEGIDSSRGSYRCDVGTSEEGGNKSLKNKVTQYEVEEITGKTSEQKHGEEASVPNRPDEETSQEIEANHIE